MRAIQIVELGGPESLQLADIDEPTGDGVADRRPRRGGLLPRGAADARRSTRSSRSCRSCPAARWRASVRADAHGFKAGDRVAAFCMLGGFAEVGGRARALHVQAVRTRSTSRRAPGWSSTTTRRTSRWWTAGACRPARPCSCTARPAASAPRRCRWPRGWARGRSRSSPATRRRRSRARRARTRCCARTVLEGRRRRRSAAPTS